MKKVLRSACAVFVALTVTSCAPARVCPSGSWPMVSDALFFGSATPAGPVSEQQWTEFVEEVVTPAFPDGLTVVASKGHWKDRDGMVREDGHILYLIHPSGASAETRIDEVVRRYKNLYRQDSVMRVSSEACISF